MSTSEHDYNEIRYNPQFLPPCAQSTSTPSASCNNSRLLLTDLSNFCQTIDCCRVNSYLSEIVNPFLIEPPNKPLIQLKDEKSDQSDYQQQSKEATSGINEEAELNGYPNSPTLDERKPMTCAFYYSNPGTEATWISVEPSDHPVADLEPKIEPDDWPNIPADLTTTSTPITTVNRFNDGYSPIEIGSAEPFNGQCKLNQTSTSPISSSTDISCYNSGSSVSIDHPNLLINNNPVSFHYHEDLNGLHSKQNRFPFSFLNGSYRYHNAVGRIRGGNLLSKEEQRVNACRRERVRMKAMNLAFDALRACINPSLKPRGRKFSKIETLRAAIVYISDLNEILNSDCNVDSSNQIFMSTSSGFYGWPRVSLMHN
uniref:BHLH domain-containing protein n=1 Tax=Tetranychus urticae TaxID=32264 RepID=T1KCH2_TETUR